MNLFNLDGRVADLRLFPLDARSMIVFHPRTTKATLPSRGLPDAAELFISGLLFDDIPA